MKSGVELVYPEDEAEKHSRESDGDLGSADLVVVLGGDGTMLRALQRSLGTNVAGDRRQLRARSAS